MPHQHQPYTVATHAVSGSPAKRGSLTCALVTRQVPFLLQLLQQWAQLPHLRVPRCRRRGCWHVACTRLHSWRLPQCSGSGRRRRSWCRGRLALQPGLLGHLLPPLPLPLRLLGLLSLLWLPPPPLPPLLRLTPESAGCRRVCGRGSLVKAGGGCTVQCGQQASTRVCLRLCTQSALAVQPCCTCCLRPHLCLPLAWLCAAYPAGKHCGRGASGACSASLAASSAGASACCCVGAACSPAFTGVHRCSRLRCSRMTGRGAEQPAHGAVTCHPKHQHA